MTTNTTSEAAEPFLVIGAGQMRTGTYSLHLALEKVLAGKCYHMRYVSENPEDKVFWLSALSEDPSDDEWKHFFRHYRAAVDYPPVTFYKRLMEVYPEAKVVLSVRDPHDWYKSVNNTIKVQLERDASIEEGPKKTFANMAYGLIQRSIGTLDLGNEETMVEAFKRHVEEVKRCVPSEKLLIFEAMEGWPPLCNFLGVPIPNEPYPLANTTADFRARLQINK